MTFLCSLELWEDLFNCLVNRFVIPLVLVFTVLKIWVSFLPHLFLLV